jgi:hypothetical protein
MAMSPPHQRFIRAVHRRLVLARAVEHLGLCTLAGSLMLVMLLPILLWRGETTLPIMMGVALACIITAIVLTIRRWPNEMLAAGEADRQLNLADLLATSVQLRNTSQPADDVLSPTVLAMADARCGQLSPSTIVLNRLGARAWGGIGLSIALVITLACIPTIWPATSTASDTNPFSPAASPQENQTHLSSTDAVQPALHTSNFDPTNEDNTRIGLTEQQAVADHSNGQNANHSSTNSNAGSGRDAGTTSATAVETPMRNINANSANTNSSRTGSAAGGVGSTTNAGVKSSLTGTDSLVNSQSRNLPPWQAEGWSQASQSANDAVSNGTIPANYRDMVHAYFDHDAFQNK